MPIIIPVRQPIPEIWKHLDGTPPPGGIPWEVSTLIQPTFQVGQANVTATGPPARQRLNGTTLSTNTLANVDLATGQAFNSAGFYWIQLVCCQVETAGAVAQLAFQVLDENAVLQFTETLLLSLSSVDNQVFVFTENFKDGWTWRVRNLINMTGSQAVLARSRSLGEVYGGLRRDF